MSSTAGSHQPDLVARLERRLARERAARREAESISERTTTELYDALKQVRRAQALTELLGDIAVAANQADGEERALQVALDRICGFMRWPVGHALTLSTGGELVSTGLWYLDEEQTFEEFRALSERRRFAAGVGLPGRVLVSGAPASIDDVRIDPNFPRAAAASSVGLHSAFAFPVLVRRDVHAVLEFFSRDHKPVDAAALRVMGQIGAQLGRVRERRLAEDRLTQLALHDPLTGLGNRVLLLEHVEHAITAGERTGEPVSVLFLDLDDFKAVNDSLGHDVGDAVLCEVATRLQATLRANDVVSRTTAATAARFGGDEFAVLLEGCSVPEVVAERILDALRSPLSIAGQEVFTAASIGGTSADVGAVAIDVLRAANVAMHVAKRTGKHRYQAFESNMHDDAIRRHRVTAELRGAIAAGQMLIHYQPEIDCQTGRAVGAEALVRWDHPELGLVPPVDFIGVAEDTGLIVELGLFVLETACRQAVEWSTGHPGLADLVMAVNVSGRQLRDAEFVDLVAGVLRRTGLPARQLCLEVTESVLVEQLAVVDDVLDGLRALGVELAIDDFGTGYSSLSTLSRLPVDVLKIDRAFIAALGDDDDAGSIVWTISSLGHRLGLRVIAEGVETEAQLRAVIAYDCDVAQGYLFARPGPPDAILSMMLAIPAPTPVG